MDFNNKHVVLIILIIIFFVFVYNYDVYVIKKGEPLCKPIYVIKRELEPEILKELTESEKVVINEAFTTDYFGNINMNESSEGYQLPPKSLLSFHVPEVTDPNKTAIIDSVIKVLSYIPTNINEEEIKEMLEYYGLIFQTSSSLEDFYKNVSASTKIKSYPYNTKYSQLMLFLIGKFNNDYSFYKSKCDLGPINHETSLNPNKSVTQQYLNTTESCNLPNNQELQELQESQIINNPAQEDIEDNVISEIENELDNALNNKSQKKSKKKITFSENELIAPNEQVLGELRSKKGKINKSKSPASKETRQQLRQYMENESLLNNDLDNEKLNPITNNGYPTTSELRKQNKGRNKNNQKNCNCSYQCDVDTFNNIESIDSYNSTNYEEYASF